jgi:hypothetical protein
MPKPIFSKSSAIAVESDQYKLQNEILLLLPPNEIKLLLSKLTAVFLKYQLLIQEAGGANKVLLLPKHLHDFDFDRHGRRKKHCVFVGCHRCSGVFRGRWFAL